MERCQWVGTAQRPHERDRILFIGKIGIEATPTSNLVVKVWIGSSGTSCHPYFLALRDGITCLNAGLAQVRRPRLDRVAATRTFRTKPKGVREIYQVAVGVAIQIQATSQADRVLLRERTPSRVVVPDSSVEPPPAPSSGERRLASDDRASATAGRHLRSYGHQA